MNLHSRTPRTFPCQLILHLSQVCALRGRCADGEPADAYHVVDAVQNTGTADGVTLTRLQPCSTPRTFPCQLTLHLSQVCALQGRCADGEPADAYHVVDAVQNTGTADGVTLTRLQPCRTPRTFPCQLTLLLSQVCALQGRCVDVVREMLRVLQTDRCAAAQAWRTTLACSPTSRQNEHVHKLLKKHDLIFRGLENRDFRGVLPFCSNPIVVQGPFSQMSYSGCVQGHMTGVEVHVVAWGILAFKHDFRGMLDYLGIEMDSMSWMQFRIAMFTMVGDRIAVVPRILSHTPQCFRREVQKSFCTNSLKLAEFFQSIPLVENLLCLCRDWIATWSFLAIPTKLKNVDIKCTRGKIFARAFSVDHVVVSHAANLNRDHPFCRPTGVDARTRTFICTTERNWMQELNDSVSVSAITLTSLGSCRIPKIALFFDTVEYDVLTIAISAIDARSQMADSDNCWLQVPVLGGCGQFAYHRCLMDAALQSFHAGDDSSTAAAAYEIAEEHEGRTPPETREVEEPSIDNVHPELSTCADEEVSLIGQADLSELFIEEWITPEIAALADEEVPLDSVAASIDESASPDDLILPIANLSETCLRDLFANYLPVTNDSSSMLLDYDTFASRGLLRQGSTHEKPSLKYIKVDTRSKTWRYTIEIKKKCYGSTDSFEKAARKLLELFPAQRPTPKTKSIAACCTRPRS